MIRVSKCLASVTFGALLQGCMTTYIPAPDEPMVTVRAVGYGRPQLCKDGQFYWAPEVKDSPGGISVPAGQRITVGAHLVSDGYQVIYYCRPFLSFIPQVGQSYVMNSAMGGEGRCLVELVREDAATRTGLAIEPSVARANCSPRQ